MLIKNKKKIKKEKKKKSGRLETKWRCVLIVPWNAYTLHCFNSLLSIPLTPQFFTILQPILPLILINL